MEHGILADGSNTPGQLSEAEEAKLAQARVDCIANSTLASEPPPRRPRSHLQLDPPRSGGPIAQKPAAHGPA